MKREVEWKWKRKKKFITSAFVLFSLKLKPRRTVFIEPWPIFLSFFFLYSWLKCFSTSFSYCKCAQIWSKFSTRNFIFFLNFINSISFSSSTSISILLKSKLHSFTLEYTGVKFAFRLRPFRIKTEAVSFIQLSHSIHKHICIPAFFVIISLILNNKMFN